ncbi:hypothetical protein [Nocardia nova]|uniref:hypothetical protein n=1 Tax=Nocardia nova TaxID=37330 RepID=UPI0026A8EA61
MPCCSSLVALDRSAHTVRAAYESVAQQISGAHQLVTNTGGNTSTVVGMSMAPPLWIVNFALIYILNPASAAAMPSYWAPIPGPVVDAMKARPTGQVRARRVRFLFRVIPEHGRHVAVPRGSGIGAAVRVGA